MLIINFTGTVDCCDCCCRTPYLSYRRSTLYKTQYLNYFVDVLSLIIDIVTLIIFIFLCIVNTIPRIPCFILDGMQYLDNYITPEISTPN